MVKQQPCKGIVEADETLFARSEKGNRTLERKPRKEE
jgi:hypothetical protein